MAWPTDDLDTTDLDAGTDSPSSARADLLALMQKVQAILAQRAVADGLCDLDSSTKVPIARIPQGAGSGLDADTVDGLSPTSAATANTVASRDASGNSAFATVNVANLGLTHAAATRSTDTVFYSSGGSTVNKNTGAGMRASLSVYSKAEVDAALAGAGDLELISSSVGFSGVTAVEFTGDYSAYSSLELIGKMDTFTISNTIFYCDVQDGGSWRALATDYAGTQNFDTSTTAGPLMVASSVVSETAFVIDVLGLAATQHTTLLSRAGHASRAFFSTARRNAAAAVSGVRVRALGGFMAGTVYLYGRKL